MNKELLLEYQDASDNLKKFKKLELELRNKIIKSFRYKKTEGVEHRSFEDEGFCVNLVIDLKLRRSIDKDAVETLWSDLSGVEKDCFKHEPSLITAEYKKLVESGDANILMEVVTEKPAQASLKLKFIER